MNLKEMVDTKLQVSLPAIKENYKILVKKLAPDSICGATVKANAYGLGMLEVSTALYQVGCRHFFVHTFSEGMELRRILNYLLSADSKEAANIYILGGVTLDHLKEYVIHDLIPVLNYTAQVDLWATYALGTNRALKAVIHIDTGMNRLGLKPCDLDTSVLRQRLNSLDILYLMSHLSCADIPNHPMNLLQLRTFKESAELLGKLSGGAEYKLSFANSSAIFLGKDYHMNLARPGCAIYGMNPTPGKKNPMHPVIKLQARILQISRVKKGEAVSYMASYIAPRDRTLITIACGYADGYLRALSNNGYAYLDEYKLPIVGIVTMDMLMLDASEVPPQQLAATEYVELINSKITVDDIAATANTIGYEILTRIGHRVKREYIE
jgi:alanine racemase